MADYKKTEAKEVAKERLRGIYSAFCLPEIDGHIDEEVQTPMLTKLV